MNELERIAIHALALMVDQYLTLPGGYIDHSCMTAGEEAVEVLAAAGLVYMVDIRGGRWTDLGRFVLDHGSDSFRRPSPSTALPQPNSTTLGSKASAPGSEQT